MTRHLFLLQWATMRMWMHWRGRPALTGADYGGSPVGPPNQRVRVVGGIAALLARSAAAAAAAVAELSAPAPEVPASEHDRVLRYGDLALDVDTREVQRGGHPIALTKMEFRLLELFLRHPHQVLTREVIFDRVWGFGYALTSNTLNVYVGYLRRKTEAGGRPRLIHTVRGVGYVLRHDPDAKPARWRRI